MTNKDLFEALRTFEKEKGIPMDYMLQNIEKAISVACKNYYGGNENVVFKVDPEKNSFDAKLVKTVVDEVFDPNFEVTVEEAQQINKRKKFIVGDEIEVPIDPKHLGWTSVSSARNVIRQGIRQGEKGQTLIEFQSKLGEIVTATVERIDPKSGVATIKIGKSEATLPKSEQLGHDDLKEGDHIKVYIADVKDNERGPHAIISRTHPGLVKRLFEQEVPEIYDGVVEIKSISREAGSRTKMAVYSTVKGRLAVLMDGYSTRMMSGICSAEFSCQKSDSCCARTYFWSLVSKSTSCFTAMIPKSTFRRLSLLQAFARLKLQMKKQRAAVQPFPMVSFHLLSATKDRMPALPQDLQAGELTSVPKAVSTAKMRTMNQRQKKSPKMFSTLTKAQKAKQLFRMKQRNNQIKQRGIL